MKTLEQIFKQEPIYSEGFYSRIDTIFAFEDVFLTEKEFFAEECKRGHNEEYWRSKKAKGKKALAEYEDTKILYAVYSTECYEGSAFVLIEEDGELKEVNASHCSCYGLEGQWGPEPVTLESLELRLTEGSFGSSECFREELKEFLGVE